MNRLLASELVRALGTVLPWLWEGLWGIALSSVLGMLVLLGYLVGC